MPGCTLGSMTDEANRAEDGGDESALVSRLRLIEDQPLDDRAAAYVQVYEELQARLEGGDAPRHNA